MMPDAGKMHFRHSHQQNSSGGGARPPAWSSQLRCSQGRAPHDMVCPQAKNPSYAPVYKLTNSSTCKTLPPAMTVERSLGQPPSKLTRKSAIKHVMTLTSYQLVYINDQQYEEYVTSVKIITLLPAINSTLCKWGNHDQDVVRFVKMRSGQSLAFDFLHAEGFWPSFDWTCHWPTTDMLTVFVRL